MCDDLDFVPMDEFQKKFFLLRQDEWLDYKDQFPGYVSAECSKVAVCRVPTMDHMSTFFSNFGEGGTRVEVMQLTATFGCFTYMSKSRSPGKQQDCLRKVEEYPL